MAKISARELAELVPCLLERVTRLQDLGILEPETEDGLLQSTDVHVVRLMSAFEEAGLSQDTARAHGGRPVKWLGDGVMFHFREPAGAIRGGLELVEQAERAVSVPARIGINAGAVIVQEGDYFGRTVNVAARIADYARPREVLVSEEARRSASDAGVAFELIGDVPLKGVAKSVRLHKATRA